MNEYEEVRARLEAAVVGLAQGLTRTTLRADVQALLDHVEAVEAERDTLRERFDVTDEKLLESAQERIRLTQAIAKALERVGVINGANFDILNGRREMDALEEVALSLRLMEEGLRAALVSLEGE